MKTFSLGDKVTDGKVAGKVTMVTKSFVGFISHGVYVERHKSRLEHAMEEPSKQERKKENWNIVNLGTNYARENGNA